MYLDRRVILKKKKKNPIKIKKKRNKVESKNRSVKYQLK